MKDPQPLGWSQRFKSKLEENVQEWSKEAACMRTWCWASSSRKSGVYMRKSCSRLKTGRMKSNMAWRKLPTKSFSE